jgi:hypothetical protein
MTQGEAEMSRSMQRARRSARALLHGSEILQFIQAPKTRRLLIAAAESGAPAVTAISEKLLELVGPKDAKLAPVKQFAGLCVRAVLEEEGFEQADAGVRLSNDPVFRTGSVYRRRRDSDSSDLLARFVASLTDDEARRAKILLRRRADQRE